jgi:hypothetical protein
VIAEHVLVAHTGVLHPSFVPTCCSISSLSQ